MSSELLTPQSETSFPKHRFIILGVIILVILGLSAFSQSKIATSIFRAAPTTFGLLSTKTEPDKDFSPAIGYYANPFVLKASDGSTVDLRDYAGKNVVLVFQTTWCQYCREEKDLLNKMSHDSRFSLISIDIRESDRLVEKHLKDFGIEYPWYIDDTGDVSHWYLVAGTPTHIFINKDGKVIRRETGYRNEAQLNDAIDALLAS